jgi:hypothetical protein
MTGTEIDIIVLVIARGRKSTPISLPVRGGEGVEDDGGRPRDIEPA